MNEAIHGQIIAEIASLKTLVVTRLDGVGAGLQRHTEQIDAIHARLASGQVVLGKIDDMRHEFTVALKGMEERQGEDRQEIKKLIAEDNQRKGRNGVWAAILRSPVFGWIAGIATTIGVQLGIGKVS